MIIRGLDVVDFPGTCAVELDHGLALGTRVVVHGRLKVGKTTRGKLLHLPLVELVTHANLECSRDDSYVLASQMVVGRDLVAVWHLQAHGVRTRLSRIALQYHKLCPWRKGIRCRPPLDGIRGIALHVLGQLLSS